MFDLAYIDPTSGSILLQALLAGVLGLVWRVSNIFRRKKTEAIVYDQAPAAQPDETAANRR